MNDPRDELNHKLAKITKRLDEYLEQLVDEHFPGDYAPPIAYFGPPIMLAARHHVEHESDTGLKDDIFAASYFKHSIECMRIELNAERDDEHSAH